MPQGVETATQETIKAPIGSPHAVTNAANPRRMSATHPSAMIRNMPRHPSE